MGVIRFLFALTVLLSHEVDLFGLTLTGSIIAVQCFYIISGFYMGIILEEKYKLSDYKLFISNRFLRLLPTYWMVVLFMIVTSIIWFNFSEQKSSLFFEKISYHFSELSFSSLLLVFFSNIFLIFQDVFLFLGLSIDGHYEFVKDFRTTNLSLSIFSLVPQAWTIGMEIMFYLLVPFVVRLKNYFLIGLAIAAFLFRLLMYYKGYDFDPWTYRFFPFEFMFFIFGLLAFRFYKYLRIKALSSLIQNVTYGFILSFILFYQFIPLNASFKYVCFLILFSFSLPIIFVKFKSNKLDRWIGEFSYPIYICHLFIIVVVNLFYSKYNFVSHKFLSVIILVCTLIFSFFLIKFISEPIEKIRRKRTVKLNSK